MPSELPTPCPALTTPPPGQCSDSTDDCSETMCCNELGAKCFTSKMSELATDGLTRFHTSFCITCSFCESFRILFDMPGLGVFRKYIINSVVFFLLACPIFEEQFLITWLIWYTARDAEVTDRLRT